MTLFNNSFKILLTLFAFVVVLGTMSCNKAFPEKANELRTDYPDDEANVGEAGAKKVLYLIIDGARGSEVDSMRPANIAELTKAAVYTWRSVNGYNMYDTTVTGSWATMLTGVNSAKHKVINDPSTGNFSAYPTVIERIKATQPAYSISSFASTPLFSQKLAAGADKNTIAADNDASVAEGVISELSSNQNARLVIGQFNSVAKAGDQFGYSHRVPQYAAAINTVDGYIGNIMAALKNRSTYSKEDWLVVVASNQNGSINYNRGGDSTSAYDDTRRNSFTILHNKRFASRFLPYPASTRGLSVYQDSALFFTGIGSSGVNVTLNDPSRFLDLDPGKSFTLEMKFKMPNSRTATGGGSWMNVLSTQAGYYSNGNGWSLRYSDNFLFYISDAVGNYANFVFDDKGAIKDDNWHSLVITCNWPAGEEFVYVNAYIDGQLSVIQGRATIRNGGLKSGRPLTVGAITGPAAERSMDIYMTNVRYWNTALPHATVLQYYCRPDIPANSPYINNLVMNYKMNDGGRSTTVRDYSPRNNPAGVVNDPSNKRRWDSFADISNAICPAPDNNFYKATPNGVDIPLHIYQWLSIIPSASWGLEGIYWPSNYNDVVLPERY